MRKKTIRYGMRLVLAALSIVIVISFYLDSLGSSISLSYEVLARIYNVGIFIAAALGGYGVVLSAFGLVLPSRPGDNLVRILPLFFLILGAISLFFYLLASSLLYPIEHNIQPLRPGETITI